MGYNNTKPRCIIAPKDYHIVGSAQNGTKMAASWGPNSIKIYAKRVSRERAGRASLGDTPWGRFSLWKISLSGGGTAAGFLDTDICNIITKIMIFYMIFNCILTYFKLMFNPF